MLDFSKNYFALFELPEHYDLDTADLAERYRELQRVVHPDRYANASEQERRLAVQDQPEKPPGLGGSRWLCPGGEIFSSTDLW